MKPVPSLRAKVLALVHAEPETMRAVLDGDNQQEAPDVKLANLSVRIGLLASYLPDVDWRRNRLRSIYGYVTGWLLNLGQPDIATQIHLERERQEQFFHAGKFLFTCSSAIAGPHRKFRILFEEGGEVAEALDKLELAQERNQGRSVVAIKRCREHLKTELIQVAAVTVAWLESLGAK